ncbi:peptidase [Xylanimonas allomyrinae]|uniref:peptidase n=1 Tax=Xylanimonas allomyrinae TaxID=2509459 RepID=UPI001FEC92A7|nr:peptidase [Xylanimonas allomyrinae]
MSTLVLAGALATVPVASAVADTYPATEYNATVSDSAPSVGTPFTVTATGPVGNHELTLTITSSTLTDSQIQIAGTKSLTKPAVNGVATFQVTLAAEGTCDLAVYDAAGKEISRQTITTDGAAAAAKGAAAGTNASAAGDALPRTGAPSLELAGLAGALALAGAGAVGLASARRRRFARA